VFEKRGEKDTRQGLVNRGRLWGMRFGTTSLTLVAFLGLIGLTATGCSPKQSADTASTSGADGATKKPVVAGTLPDLKIEDTKVGTGKGVENGDSIWVLYTGKLQDGTVFDSTDTRGNKPLKVHVGLGEVIPGWDKGLLGLKLHGERKLSIPWKLAYGEKGQEPKIPAKADLFFTVKAVAIVRKGEEGIVDAVEKNVGSGRAVGKGDTVTVSYVGTLPTGEEFDSTKKQGKNVTFKIGNDEVLAGLDAGVVGMKEGGERVINVPPQLGLPYGSDKIPSDSVLIFDVKLVKVGR
jgi:FKBP-type peptidyl-prolyl cis-trans isomerase